MASRKGAEHASNIMAALTASPRPLSAYDLLDQLRPTGVSAPLTVYRALDKLVGAGKVHRIASLNAFVACRDGHDHAHPHGHGHAAHGEAGACCQAEGRTVGFAICDACGTVEEFVDPQLSDRVRTDLARRHFQPRSSALEIHGLCARCATVEPPRVA